VLASSWLLAACECGRGDMPEGDTVWLAAQRLHEALAGGTLTTCDFRVPALATVDLRGATVVNAAAHGKHLLIRLTYRDQALTLRSHLRMDGTWHIYDFGKPWRGGPRHWIRAVLGTNTHTAVGYRVSMLTLVDTAAEGRLLGHLGPNILDPQFDVQAAAHRLARNPERPIGEALLDQRIIAGLGTNLVAETCFVLGLHPGTTVGTSDCLTVVTRAQHITAVNAPRASRVTTGNERQPAWVHGRRTCLRCGSRLQRLSVRQGSAMRQLAFCPHCQSDRPRV